MFVSDSGTVTDEGILSITHLPELEYLSLSDLDAITDQALNGLMPKLKKLECSRCFKIKNEGVSQFIQTSHTIEWIRLYCCREIVASNLIDNVINNCKREKLRIEIDSSEIECSLVTHINTMDKFGNCVIREMKKHCYGCLMSKLNECSKCVNTRQILSLD